MTVWAYYHLFGALAAFSGLCVGSFLNVCIARMPEDRSVVSPPSHCPACGHAIRAYDNIPVISWLLLRAKCRDCGTPISGLYPAIELLVGMLAWLLYRRIVPGPGQIDVAHGAAWAFFLVFVAMLVAQTYIDIRHYIIPDEFSIYAVPVGVAGHAALGWLGYADALPWTTSVVGALVGGGLLAGVMGTYWLIRREEGMGLGDVKLLAMIGAFLGAIPAVPFVIFVASLAGAAVGVPIVLLKRRGMRTALPFGPFLALGAVTWVLFGEELVSRFFPALSRLMAG